MNAPAPIYRLTPELDKKVRLRPMQPGDLNMVLSSWLESFRDNSRSAELVPKAVYFPMQRELAQRLIGRGLVIVACNPVDYGHIFGWALFERIGSKPVLHFAYVKQDFRRCGIARALLEMAGCSDSFYTHHTLHSPHLVKRYRLAFNPYLVGAAL